MRVTKPCPKESKGRSMTVELVYHREGDATSPFDARAIGIARNADLRIACPYLTLDYLRRLIGVSASWRLLTEIEEWLASLGRDERRSARDFIVENERQIRHAAGLHAKVLIGARGALIGSANFTTSGIQRRTEMAVFVDDEPNQLELVNWFDAQWNQAKHIPIIGLNDFVDALPSAVSSHQAAALFEYREPRLVPLISVSGDQIPNEKNGKGIRRFLNASGCYIGIGKQFRVMRGSKANGEVKDAFRTHANGKYNEIRGMLIRSGILSREYDWQPFDFTQDYTFTAPSPAACIVAGYPCSGIKSWGPQRF